MTRDKASILFVELKDWRDRYHRRKVSGGHALQSSEALLRLDSREIDKTELFLQCLDGCDAGPDLIAAASIYGVNPAVEHDRVDCIDLVSLKKLVNRT